MVAFINTVANLITFLLLAYVILSYVMSPFHPVRESLEKIIRPMLDPIRRVMPNTGGVDFSPIVLWLLIRLVANLLINLVRM